MGWPKKDKMRLYYDRTDKSYLMVLQGNNHRNPNGCQECVSELMEDNDPNNPKLCLGSVHPDHIRGHCKRVSWGDLPKVWQDEFLSCYLHSDPEYMVEPENVRGFWRTEEWSKK
jgi:hypothetical protein